MAFRLFLGAVFIALGLPVASATAAPQILGLVASAEPLPMTCEGGTCVVELSAFCLERDRSMPEDGTPYQALEAGKLTLVVTAADGSERRIPAEPYVRIASARGYSAVAVSLPEQAAQALGAVKLALAVGPQLALAPEAVEADRQPLSEEEIARARTTLIAIAGDVVERGAPEAVAARILNRLINLVPRERTVDEAAAGGLWLQAAGRPFRLSDPEPGFGQAGLFFDYCRTSAVSLGASTLRGCLAMSHDALMSGVNSEYWRIVGSGS